MPQFQEENNKKEEVMDDVALSVVTTITQDRNLFSPWCFWCWLYCFIVLMSTTARAHSSQQQSISRVNGNYHKLFNEYSSAISRNLATRHTRHEYPRLISSTKMDREVLNDLFASTHGASWYNNWNWNTTAPLSEWYGVTIDVSLPIDHQVTSLDLSFNNLIGE